MDSSLLYKRLDRTSLDIEQSLINSVRGVLNAEWEAEMHKYEESMAVTLRRRPLTQTVPRRNYFNPQGVVQDTSLFPYHNSFYRLIDAYDCLYEEGQEQPIDPDSVIPYKQDIDILQQGVRQNTDKTFILASKFAICACLLQKTLSVDPAILLSSNAAQLWFRLEVGFAQGKSRQEVLGEDEVHPTPSLVQPQILLKILRHALSVLQRDHFLAEQVLLCMARRGDLDDPCVLRDLLVIVRDEHIDCGHRCRLGQGEDHTCHVYRDLLKTLWRAVGTCVSHITQDHAVVIAGFVQAAFSQEFGHLIAQHSDRVETKRRALLKRTAVTRQLEQADEIGEETGRQESHRVPVRLVGVIVDALGHRASLERRRCLAASKRTDVSEKTLRLYIDSFWNCIRALVEMGETATRMLPDSERFYRLSSTIVKSLVFGMSESELYWDEDLVRGECGYLRSRAHRTCIYPLRYFDTIVGATQRSRARRALQERESANGVRGAIICALHVEKPNDIRDVVRALFVADKVEIGHLGIGYGDFLLLCGYDIDPLDPVLFW